MTGPKAIDAYVAALEPPGRRVAEGEWGLSIDVAGWPLHIGMRIAHGVLLAQANVLGPDQLDAETLLRANRRLDLAAFAMTESGEVWAKSAAPLAGMNEPELDRLLAVLVRAAEWARRQAGG